MYKIMIAALVLGLGGLFFIKLPNGQPVISLDSLKPDVQDISLPNLVSGNTEPQNETQLYRYQDANGNWVYTDQAQEHAETVTVDTSANNLSMPAVAIPARKESAPAAIQVPDGLPITSPNKLIENAKSVEKVLADRDEKMRQAMP